MTDKDQAVWAEIIRIYDRYRSTEMHEDDWKTFVREVAAFAEKNDYKNNPLVNRLGMALFDIFDDLYRGGKTPEIPDYFGRDDL